MDEPEREECATLENLIDAAQQPRRYKYVVLPVCKLKLRIQSLTEREKSELETEAVSRDGSQLVKQRVVDARRRLIQKCVCEPKLERQHIEMLGDFDGADMGYLHREIARHVGWSAEDIEKMEGNFGTATATD